MTDDSTTWEFRTLVPPREATQKEADDPEAEMNELGAEGWAFAGTIDYTGGGTKFLLFKRPRSAGEDGD
ncbi:hypothetical protein [Halalkalicoccus subterraneus]|uniref:hypothetical protein n=1 Tax=Halalkalicoccus subterraneus TaxID=2675002 RepID=UPI000EFCC715|nr:hypothetical protein [Halalkalicoccus subterraneus]